MESIARSSFKENPIAIFFCFMVLCLGFTSNSFSQSVTRISIINEGCKTVKTGCKCKVSKFSCDPNIYMRQLEGEYRTTKSEANMSCFTLDLLVYGSKISLDSIYYSKIRNKDLLYIGGFIGGVYSRKKDVIELKLSFINRALNTSAPQDHVFALKYDITKKQFTDVKLHLN